MDIDIINLLTEVSKDIDFKPTAQDLDKPLQELDLDSLKFLELLTRLEHKSGREIELPSDIATLTLRRIVEIVAPQVN